jgi:hypothetical protein
VLLVATEKVDPRLDRKGKLHSAPGMRIKEKIEDAHQFEAALLGDVSRF